MHEYVALFTQRRAMPMPLGAGGIGGAGGQTPQQLQAMQNLLQAGMLGPGPGGAQRVSMSAAQGGAQRVQQPNIPSSSGMSMQSGANLGGNGSMLYSQ